MDMLKEKITTAIGTYGYTKSLINKSISSPRFETEHIDISPIPMVFRRMVRGLEFDVAEMAFSTYICSKYYGKKFTAIPVFITRAFYHGQIACHKKSRIEQPTDLAGKRVGLRSYTLNPGVWTRALLKTRYGLNLDEVTWVLSGDEHVQEYNAPANVISSEKNDLEKMLMSGEVDALIGAGPINSPDVVPLFEDSKNLDKEWYIETGIYPISHLLVVKDQILEEHPWIAEELHGMFKSARDVHLEEMDSKTIFSEQDNHILGMKEIVEDNPLPYEFNKDKSGIARFIDFTVDQEIIPEVITPESLFPEYTLGFS